MTYKELEEALNKLQKETSFFLRNPTVSRIRHYRFRASFYLTISRRNHELSMDPGYTVDQIKWFTKMFKKSRELYTLINDTLWNLKNEICILKAELDRGERNK